MRYVELDELFSTFMLYIVRQVHLHMKQHVQCVSDVFHPFSWTEGAAKCSVTKRAVQRATNAAGTYTTAASVRRPRV